MSTRNSTDLGEGEPRGRSDPLQYPYHAMLMSRTSLLSNTHASDNKLITFPSAFNRLVTHNLHVTFKNSKKYVKICIKYSFALATPRTTT